MKTPPALIITYNPPLAFKKQIAFFFEQFEKLLIVDNGSNLQSQYCFAEMEQAYSNLEIIYNRENLGIATALNQGFLWAIEQGYKEVVTFDQDSFPAAGMVAAYRNTQRKGAGQRPWAIIAPVIADPVVAVNARYLRSWQHIFFERKACEEDDLLKNITMVITAGALHDLSVYQEIGPFREDFFIDYVDTEYCLRANQHGYKIIVACDAKINHRLGEREKRSLLGRVHYPTFHSPLRWYYISRNRIPMLKKYALRFPHWFFYEIIASTYTFLRMIVFEDQRLKKLLAIFLGTRDGLWGRMGRASDRIQQKLS